jgi:hypothetical protein
MLDEIDKDEIEMNTKIKRKRDMVQPIDLTEDDKKFLESKEQLYVREFLEIHG